MPKDAPYFSQLQTNYDMPCDLHVILLFTAMFFFVIHVFFSLNFLSNVMCKHLISSQYYNFLMLIFSCAIMMKRPHLGQKFKVSIDFNKKNHMQLEWPTNLITQHEELSMHIKGVFCQDHVSGFDLWNPSQQFIHIEMGFGIWQTNERCKLVAKQHMGELD